MTCGVPVEVVAYDNSRDRLGICAVYNQLLSKCAGEICCFAHDDILFLKSGWGKELTNVLAQPSVGLVGVAGCDLISRTAVPWWVVGRKFTFMSVVSSFDRTGKPRQKANHRKSGLYPAVILDGVFLAARHEVFRTLSFDETSFPGFHFYDLDLSMQISKKAALIIDCNIPIYHASEGKYDLSWQNDLQSFLVKWKTVLPACVSFRKAYEVASALEMCEGVYHATNRNLCESTRYFLRAMLRDPLQLPLYHTIKKLFFNSLLFPSTSD